MAIIILLSLSSRFHSDTIMKFLKKDSIPLRDKNHAKQSRSASSPESLWMIILRLLSLLIGYSKVSFEQVTVTQSSASDKTAALLYCHTFREKYFRHLNLTTYPLPSTPLGSYCFLKLCLYFLVCLKNHKAC